LSLRKLFSPTPRTFISSSIFLKPPFFCRYSMISCAVAGPMPGSVSSCSCVAVFRLTGASASSAGFGAAGRGACAAAVATPRASAITVAVIIRVIVSPPIVIAHARYSSVAARATARAPEKIPTGAGGL
jgi:hypothetical protein